MVRNLGKDTPEGRKFLKEAMGKPNLRNQLDLEKLAKITRDLKPIESIAREDEKEDYYPAL